jgi:hypothetical protein
VEGIENMKKKFLNMKDHELVALYKTYKNLQSRGVADEITENLLFDELYKRKVLLD